MFQQIIAILFIAFFLSRLVGQKRKNTISANEFRLWLFFWLLVAVFILLIKKIDALVAGLGFSATGIDALLYLAVAMLFYLIFKLRIKQEKVEREITKIVSEIAIRK